jgi:hypothetical protein
VTADGTLLRQVAAEGLDLAELLRACTQSPGCTAFDSLGSLKITPLLDTVTYSDLPQQPDNATCWGAWVSSSSRPHSRWLGGLRRDVAAAREQSARATSVFNATYLLSRRIRKQGNSALASAGIFVGEQPDQHASLQDWVQPARAQLQQLHLDLGSRCLHVLQQCLRCISLLLARASWSYQQQVLHHCR